MHLFTITDLITLIIKMQEKLVSFLATNVVGFYFGLTKTLLVKVSIKKFLYLYIYI